MKNKVIQFAVIFALVGTLFAFAQGKNAPYFDGVPNFQTVRYESSLPSAGRFPGEIVGVIVNGSTPVLYFWDDADGDWERISQGSEEAAAFDSTVSVAGALSASGDVVLGNNEDDTVTANAPVVFEVFREDFDSPRFTVNDITAGTFVAVVADTNQNVIQFGTLPLYYRVEQAFGGTYTPATFMNGQAFNIDDDTILDVVDNDAIEFVVGGPPLQSFMFDTDSTETAYCEASVTIAAIANVSALDFYFGVAAAASIDDAFAFEAATSRAVFVISDTSGDLDITTELAAGGTLNDDSGIAWTNGQTKVLRVEVSAADVDFYVDGVQITQVNAVLDPAAATMLNCRFGIRSAGTTKAGVAVNYVEVGRAQ